MKDFKYKFVGNYNINTLIELLNNKSGNDWDFWNRKQGRFQAHSETKTIPLLLDEEYGYTDEMQEINNSSLHSVNNNGDTDRIHMVIDYKPVIFTLL